MKFFFPNLIVLFVSMVLFTQCSAPPLPSLKGMTYLQQNPIPISVKTIEVINESLVRESDTEKLLSYSLIDVTKQWAKESFITKGNRNTLRIVIQEASIKEVFLRPYSGMKKMFYTQNTEKLKGKLKICLEYSDESQRTCNRLTIAVHDEKNISESHTLKNRREILASIHESLINQLTTTLKTHLPLFE